MTDEVTILPIAAHATKLISENYGYGDVVKMTDLYRMLEVELSKDFDQEQYENTMWLRCSRIEDLKKRLLEGHSIMLQNIRGEGYVLVMPKEQTDVVLDHMDGKIKKHMRTASKRLKHIRFDLLSEKKQQENISGRQRVAGIKSMLRRERKLFASGLKQINPPTPNVDETEDDD
jgi:hypothetical protein